MARLVYACRFDLPNAKSLESVVAPAYENWLRARYSRAHRSEILVSLLEARATGTLPAGHSLSVDRYESDSFATQINWAFPGADGLIWRNIVRLAALGGVCAVEHRVQLQSADYFIAPASFDVGAPAVVREICERNSANVGDVQFQAKVYPFGRSGTDKFVDLLTSPLRRLPIVLVTPFANGSPSVIDANSLAKWLAGVAVVACADGTQTTRVLSDRIGPLGSYNGAIRIYWPGFQLDDDIHGHPLIFGARVESLGSRRVEHFIERSILSVSAFRFVPDSRIDAIIASCEAVRRAERVATVREEGGTTWEQYALEISKELDELKANINELKAENANLRDNQKLLF